MQGTVVWEIKDWAGQVLGLHVAWWPNAAGLPWEVEHWRIAPWLPNVFYLEKDTNNAIYGEITGGTRAERNQQANEMWDIFLTRYNEVPGTEALEYDGGEVREIPNFVL